MNTFNKKWTKLRSQKNIKGKEQTLNINIKSEELTYNNIQPRMA